MARISASFGTAHFKQKFRHAPCRGKSVSPSRPAAQFPPIDRKGYPPVEKSTRIAYRQCMKKILLLTSVITLITTSGCIGPDGRGRSDFRGEEGHEHFEHHEDVIVAPPVIDVRPPEVIVR
jgi:hypothetical protein